MTTLEAEKLTKNSGGCC